MTGRPGTDPLHRLESLLSQELSRLTTRRDDLADAGNALMMLRSQLHSGGASTPVGVEGLSQELAATVVDRISSSVDRVDNVVTDLSVGAGSEEVHASHELGRTRAGQAQRTLVTEEVLAVPEKLGHINALRAAGQEQRVLDRITHEFAIFGDDVVVTPSRWEDPSSDYLVIRHPALVRSFQCWFDLVWSVSPPRRESVSPVDERLVRLLALGYKDEAISRHLGIALRTVRRRVAGLMDAHGVSTRFQLGAVLAREGLLP